MYLPIYLAYLTHLVTFEGPKILRYFQQAYHLQMIISYIIQGIATIILGPVLTCILLIVEARRPDAADSFFEFEAPPWLAALIRLARRHHQANSVVGVSVRVASIIHISQVRPVAEVDFVSFVALYQLFVGLGSFMTIWYNFCSPA